MIEQVRQTMARHGMLAPGVRVAVAVSGGADSVCLLHVLRELSGSMDFVISEVVHVNHRLRGEESEADAAFVAELAERMGVPLSEVVAEIDPDGANLEAAARAARREAFFRVMTEDRADRVAVGHTRDDQAETVLFRLLRGTGVAGLAGILPVTGEGLIRPLIEVSRAEVRQWLTGRRIEWREDSSNTDLRFARNRIRHELLPHLEDAWNPQLSGQLARLADLAGEEEAAWRAWIERRVAELEREEALVVARKSGGRAEAVEIRVEALAEVPRALARRLVRWIVAELAPEDLPDRARFGAGFEHIDRIVDLARSSAGDGGVTLPGLEASRSCDWIRVAPVRQGGESLRASLSRAVDLESGALAAGRPGIYPAPDGKSLIHLALNGQPPAPDACATLGLDLTGWASSDFSALRFTVRAWMPGDGYQPAGKSRWWKVKELFDRARVPSWKRDKWPILTMDGRIVWVRQFGLVDAASIGQSSRASDSSGPGPWLWITESFPNTP